MTEFIYGTPSLEESNSLWKRFPDEYDIDGDQYDIAANSLVAHLSRRYDYGVDGHLYVRGDFQGDRTQYVEICSPQIVNEELVGHLQSWVCEIEDGAWRVLIPTYVEGDAAIIVYKRVIRIGRRWDENIAESLATIRRLMQEDNDKL